MTWQNKYFRGITLKRWYLKYAVMKPCDGRYTRVVYRIPLTLKVTVGATVLNLTPENLGLLEKQRLLADGGGGGGRVARELRWGRVLTSIPSIIWFSGVQQFLNFQVQSRDHGFITIVTKNRMNDVTSSNGITFF